MFSLQQLNSIDRKYFMVFESAPYLLVLKSKNTRHYWRIQPTGKKNQCSIYHSHCGDCNYHFQCNSKDLEESLKTIREHDKYQLTHRRPENNYLDYTPLLPDSEYFVF